MHPTYWIPFLKEANLFGYVEFSNNAIFSNNVILDLNKTSVIMASGGTSTLSKHYVSMVYTPTTKKSVCVVCGRKQESDKHRVKLFKNDNKSEACLLVEKYLDIQFR